MSAPQCNTPFDLSALGHVIVAPPIVVDQGCSKTTQYTLMDTTGAYIPLPAGATVEVLARAAYWSSLLTFDISGTLSDADHGVVEFTVPALTDPGMYCAEIRITDPGSGETSIYRCYLHVKRSLKTRTMGPPTIFEIRLMLRDMAPGSNFLLDETEWTDEELAFSMTIPIDFWNETPPCVRIFSYANFPFRYNYMIGVIGQLFTMGAAHYVRNAMDTKLAGGLISDQEKYQQYSQIGMLKWKEFTDFVRAKKVEMNMALGFGTKNSIYRRLW